MIYLGVLVWETKKMIFNNSLIYGLCSILMIVLMVLSFVNDMMLYGLICGLGAALGLVLLYFSYNDDDKE